jgi:hypothetical protein
MSDTGEPPVPLDASWDWEANRAKLYGWLAGVALMAFGGLLCSVPAGVILGLPAVAFGLFLAITFAASLASASVPTPTAMALFVCGLALVVGGAVAAPLGWIAQSFREGRTLVPTPSIPNVLGLPMLLIGNSLVGISVQWLRPPASETRLRRGFAVAIIQLGVLALLIGVLLSSGSRRIADQPTWAWVAVPVLLGLGTLLRAGLRGQLWIIVGALSALALPVTWMLLVARSS